MKSPQSLVLASTSRYRRALLERLGIPFTSLAPGVDETALPGESARELTTRLARLKAAAVATQRPTAWIIGSDQLAVLRRASEPERILGKPGTAARCRDQLLACSGQTLDFVTAVAVIGPEGQPVDEFVDVTRVTFRALDAATIDRYVERESPLDCAGGFKCEGLGIALCDAIESADPTALIGLPLIGVGRALRFAGFTVP